MNFQFAKFFSVAAILASSAYGSVYVGCVSGPPTLGVPTANQPTADACAQACAGQTYAYWRADTQACVCASEGPPNYTIISGTATACDNNKWVALDNPTTFEWTGCLKDYQTIDPAVQSTTVGAPNTCFQNCRFHLFATFYPSDGQGTIYSCNCFNTITGMMVSNDCGPTDEFLYSHPAPAAASGLARRNVIEKRRLAEQVALANPHCPSGFSPCLLSENGLNYECLDTSSELESCGGCRYGVFGNASRSAVGIDCTALAGVNRAGVQCIQNRCKVSRCESGFKLRKGRCV